MCVTPEEIQKIKIEVRECADTLKTHIMDNDKHVVEVKGDIKAIKENHLAHIQASLQAFEVWQAKVDTKLELSGKLFWIIASASVGSMVAAILGLILG